MEVPVLMQISDGVQNLIDPVLHPGLGEVPIAVLYLLIQVLLHVLEHEVQLVVLANDFLQLHDVGVVQLAQGLHLTKGDGLLPAVELTLHLLDGNHLVRLSVRRLPHAAIRPVSELLLHLVSIHGFRSRERGSPTRSARLTWYVSHLVKDRLPRQSAPPIQPIRPPSTVSGGLPSVRGSPAAPKVPFSIGKDASQRKAESPRRRRLINFADNAGLPEFGGQSCISFPHRGGGRKRDSCRLEGYTRGRRGVCTSR